MSPTVPISRFVDEETVEPSTPTQPTVQPVEALIDVKAMTPQEPAAQLRAQLEECESLPPLEAADAERVAEETASDEEPRVKPKRKWETTAPFEPEMTEEGEKKAELPMQHGGAGMKALPLLKRCPFCGEALVEKSNQHGKWYGHRDEVGECWASLAQIHDEVDAKRWNARSEKALPAPTGLKPKQIAFIDEYMVDRNATQAYIRVGYSERGAQQSSSALLSNPVVAAEVARRAEEYSRTAGIKAIDVLLRLKAKAFTDITEFMDLEKGGLKPPKDWPEAARAAISAYDAGGPHSSEKLRLVDQTPILFELLKRLERAGPPVPDVAITQNVQVDIDKAIIRLPTCPGVTCPSP